MEDKIFLNNIELCNEVRNGKLFTVNVKVDKCIAEISVIDCNTGETFLENYNLGQPAKFGVSMNDYKNIENLIQSIA